MSKRARTFRLTALELCAGAGGQSIGLEAAGFEPAACVEIEPAACATLHLNRPQWPIVRGDIRELDGTRYRGVDLVSAGVPCPPFSIAGKQLGPGDERDLFPHALRIIEQSQPRAVLLENVRGLASDRFADYRRDLMARLMKLKYQPFWRLLKASDFGVPQLRPRFVLVAMRDEYADWFSWPAASSEHPTVGELLRDLMGQNRWRGAARWSRRANRIGPTIVGGSTKHGGPDLGPTRARREWLALGVDGMGIANEAPSSREPITHVPRLTLRMVARLQGFGDDWQFAGRKTAAYRQIGNAFPPPVAGKVASAIVSALEQRPFPKQASYQMGQQELVQR